MSKTFNMRNPDTTEVSEIMKEAEMRNSIREKGERYAMLANMMAGKDTDITADTEIFGIINSQRICIEDYMKCFPEDCALAMKEAKMEREKNEKGWANRGAKWHALGVPPVCVYELFSRVHKDSKIRKKKYREFFNEFPQYKISPSKLGREHIVMG